ncbi:hypothetical protein C488_18023 [Natrinema pellirubrum DSM 15624]|uniref:Uncharacterized protein n=1 Tax=Natrinema pellirubrum (strain DSM 15624 / CIP 106293 / JCM 10476 / NCIMB 786 / 157) TaxID=797303 RepID=L0JRM9_NATP1|nr:hypothetical protein [Natrinema pellirubrum]AGB33478.1 hypothetical protein Natpe_3716 [Natrinema pellirubrum DSM 15624]ELY71167.1 hypothetical protein C488_18023 [Natrinema pellirubrum DSM 15624]
MGPERESGPSSPGPPDRRTLRLLERRLADDPLVVGTAFDPDSTEPRVLEARLDSDLFPLSIDGARFDIRWFTTDDFTIHYVETGADGHRWECRWDRHPNPHDPRLHFHCPPDGTETADLELPSVHPLDVIATALAAVEERIDRAWDARD